ncbi:3-hexulose-6-phosphate synthase [Halalkalibacillus halophilus]|uniref:3-hexulose-6-phosphate synthase n=1 Tax=Halalkalibacillus halophilus TaxID=392827 RepID=UPI00040A27EE|nr:3-hexulose-6-phosphate synthase [Halalkalibacillus halophilus]
MKLQLALDRLTWDESMHVVDQTSSSVDIIEVGTGIIKEYGMAIVREMRKLYPNHTIMADMKTCDAGGHEAKQAFEAGADIVTVMAFSSPLTIQDTIDVAKTYSGRVMVDLLEVKDQQVIEKLNALNVDLVSLHVGKDQQKEGGFETGLYELVKGQQFEVAVAGGIKLDTLDDVMTGNPDIVIVGSAISKAEDPKSVAATIQKKISREV